jgi:hypothetical protein
LDDLLFHSRFCITHFSTAVNQAVLLNRLVLQPRWGKSQSIIDYYIRRKVAKAWSDPNVLPDIRPASEDLEQYKREYITILSADAVQNAVKQIITF